MGSKRYNSNKVYERFVSYASVGDKLINKYIDELLSESDIEDEHNLTLLKGYLISNKFLSHIKPPFKYKEKYPVLHNNLKRNVPNSRRGEAIRGDIVEVYIFWLKTNYSDEVAKRYLERQIVRIATAGAASGSGMGFKLT